MATKEELEAMAVKKDLNPMASALGVDTKGLNKASLIEAILEAQKAESKSDEKKEPEVEAEDAKDAETKEPELPEDSADEAPPELNIISDDVRPLAEMNAELEDNRKQWQKAAKNAGRPISYQLGIYQREPMVREVLIVTVYPDDRKIRSSLIIFVLKAQNST